MVSGITGRTLVEKGGGGEKGEGGRPWWQWATGAAGVTLSLLDGEGMSRHKQ